MHSRSTALLGRRIPCIQSLLVGVVCLLHTTADAGLMVYLEQLNAPAVAVSGTQTLITAAVKVSGTLASPLTTSAFSTALTWTASGTGVTNSNLYTVNSSGVPVTTSAALNVNSPGYLYYGGDGIVPLGTLNVVNLSGTNQRYVSVDGDPAYYPTLSGTFLGTTIATIRFAVSSGINNAQFNFSLNGNGTTYGFVDDTFNTVGFTNGGGLISVVPEPEMTAGIFFAASIVAVGWRKGRRWLSKLPS